METTIQGLGFRVVWRFPKIRGTILGVPIIRAVVFWGVNRGVLILGNYHTLDMHTVRCIRAFLLRGLRRRM